MDFYTIQTIISTVVVMLMLEIGIAKQIISSKAKNKMLVRVVYPNQEERAYLLELQGNTTEVNKDDCAYHITPYQEIENPDVNTLTAKYLTKGLDAKEALKKAEEDVKTELPGKKIVGSTFETRWPEGLPSWLQVRVRGMETPKGQPSGINFYSDQRLRLTDEEVGLIHRNAYVAAAISTSNDTREVLEELRKERKPKSNLVLYIILGVLFVATAASAYFGYTNSQTLTNWSWW